MICIQVIKWSYVHYANQNEKQEVSVILKACTGSRACPVSLTKRSVLVNIRNLTIFLVRFTRTSMVSPFVPDSWLTQGPTSCYRSNSKSLGSNPSSMAYTVSGRAEHPLQQLLLSQTGSWFAMGAGVHRQLRTRTLKKLNKPFWGFLELSVYKWGLLLSGSFRILHLARLIVYSKFTNRTDLRGLMI